LRGGERVTAIQIEAPAERWSLPGRRRCSRPADPDACQWLFGHAARWLRFLDILKEPNATRHAHVGEVAVFAA